MIKRINSKKYMEKYNLLDKVWEYQNKLQMKKSKKQLLSNKY